ncbi:universal stress protein family [hydrocarbon metagenome]|uniref:Universal stress protein family n=1 Tax=hydrocarbon metagenome TaxID=938273 RepID=A0A0W8FUX6_9ZZZZ
MEPIKKILVPVDFSDYSKRALRYAIDFSKHFNSELILISVIEPMIYPADFSMGQVAIPATDQNLTERIENELKTLEENEIGDQVKSKRIIKSGKPFYEIVETAREEDVDLIIIATHGHTGVEHLLFGSTAEKVVRKAPCPVLTLREPIKGFRFEK